MESFGPTLTLAFTLLALAVAFAWGWRYVYRYLQRRRQAEVAPSLSVLLAEPVRPELVEQAQRFRRPHLAQIFSSGLATGLMLVALVAIVMTEGWTLFTFLVVIAEVVLLMTHGAPLLITATQALTISDEGIRSTGLLRGTAVEWWALQRVVVEEDLSRFRAEGIRGRVGHDTSMFPPETRLSIFRAIRSHLARQQQELQPWPHARFYGLSKAAAVNLGALALVTVATILVGPEPADTLLPGQNVLGLRCAYASKYLREKYHLPKRPGCVVLRVSEGGAAEAAGLAEGQLIVALEGVPVTGGPQFTVFFESLDKRRQRFTVVRPGQEEAVTTTVTLGPPGELPRYDPKDPYFYYLRARGAEEDWRAIRDFSTAIQLAPDFDLAYVYRGELYVRGSDPDQALADLDHALELDGELSEAYRWRAYAYRDQGDYDAALADTETAIRLGGCPQAFRTYNYDCEVNHAIQATIFGRRGAPGDAERAVREAEAAIEFYPERPEPHYLAAYYLSLTGQEHEAREYAKTFLELSERHEQSPSDVEWARRLVSGSTSPDEASGVSTEVRRLSVAESSDHDLVPDGEPVVSRIRFSEEMGWDAPPEIRSLSSGPQQLWAYFEFDNAADVQTIVWEWSQNFAVADVGIEPWPGTNKGHGWILVNNVLMGTNTRSSLTIKFDGKPVATAPVSLRNDPFIGPATFFKDAVGTQPILFYAGGTDPVYAALDYVGVLPGSGLTWAVERSGVQIGEGDLALAEADGRVFVPILLPPNLEPGLIQIYFYLDWKLTRTAWLALAPQEVVQPPPFERLDIGTEPVIAKEPDGEIRLAHITKVFPVGQRQIDYVLDGVHFKPESVLSIRWYREGKAVGPFGETWLGSDGFPAAVLAFEDGSQLEQGEYQIVVSWDGAPVYADVVAKGLRPLARPQLRPGRPDGDEQNYFTFLP